MLEDNYSLIVKHPVQRERRLAIDQQPRQLGLSLLDRLVAQIAAIVLVKPGRGRVETRTRIVPASSEGLHSSSVAKLPSRGR